MTNSRSLLSNYLTLILLAAATSAMAQPPLPDALASSAICCGSACDEPACGALACWPSDCCGPDCCDEKYRSECCGKGFLLKNMRLHDSCGKVCMSKVEEVTEEKSCWKIECEEICVPRVVGPWAEGGSGLTLFNFLKKKGHAAGCGDCCDTCCGSDCCTDGCCQQPRCGDVRCVRTLASESYECTKCQCKWDIKDGCYRYGPGSCAGGCGSAGCDAAIGCGDDFGGAPLEMNPPAMPVEVPPAPASAARSANGQYRVTIAQAFGISPASCEEPEGEQSVPPVTQAKMPEQQPKRKSPWSLWK